MKVTGCGCRKGTAFQHGRRQSRFRDYGKAQHRMKSLSNQTAAVCIANVVADSHRAQKSARRVRIDAFQN
jgi:hypothetical protein